MCGAHWCYWCQRSIDECDGGCEGASYSDEDDSEDGLDQGEDNNVEDGEAAEIEKKNAAGLSQPNDPLPRPVIVQNVGVHAPAPQIPHNADPRAIINLDGGGRRRWAESGIDFGEEPADDFTAQVWSCRHEFDTYSAADDGFNHGDLTRMECNRCFRHVAPPLSEIILPASVKTRRLLRIARHEDADDDTERARLETLVCNQGEPENLAWECVYCFLIVCVRCRDKYNSEGN